MNENRVQLHPVRVHGHFCLRKLRPVHMHPARPARVYPVRLSTKAGHREPDNSPKNFD